mmetsp:Transcript_11211/g.15538  ORF Transcript_11211/g.15538 Transcript_11211/m.15538 type:complete len:255 (+) Transcript_11211:144-908(+)
MRCYYDAIPASLSRNVVEEEFIKVSYVVELACISSSSSTSQFDSLDKIDANDAKDADESKDLRDANEPSEESELDSRCCISFSNSLMIVFIFGRSFGRFAHPRFISDLKRKDKERLIDGRSLPFTTRSVCLFGVMLAKGFLRDSISHKRIEKLYASERKPYGCPKNISGAIYRMLPTAPFILQSLPLARKSGTSSFANPRLKSLTSPKASNPMFAGLTSLQTILCECKCARALAMSTAIPNRISKNSFLSTLLS